MMKIMRETASVIPGHTSPTLSPAPERTCITSRFLSQFEREGGERLRRIEVKILETDHGFLISAVWSTQPLEAELPDALAFLHAPAAPDRDWSRPAERPLGGLSQ